MADIIETASNAGCFKTLVTVIEAAGLLDLLQSPGPYTVLAPTDEAFAKIPTNTYCFLAGRHTQTQENSHLSHSVWRGTIAVDS